MRIRWPRRRWGTAFTFTLPDGTSEGPYISPRRFWTHAGALYAAAEELVPYLHDPVLRRCVTIEPVECGPFDRDAYMAELDAEELAARQREARRERG
jgi:hypothetical protein